MAKSVTDRIPYPVVLASASPRRRDLLSQLFTEFTVDAPDIDEDALTVPDPFVTAQTLAREKCLAVFDRHPDALVIAGDTVVALPNGEEFQLLGKPVNPADAVRILGLIQGQTHVVVTGMALRWPKGFSAFTEASRVTFRAMMQEEIEGYVAGGEPMDKAGAYGYQGGAKEFITRLEGSVENVIGLPVDRLREALKAVD
ncbi:MAG: septum formation protein Maf [Fimbriimonadaceae bacterium]|nr:septum formation protein Maf [Fimbriimonadaceae bacterium]